MWNIFRSNKASHSPGEEGERMQRDLQARVEERLEALARRIKECGDCLEGYAAVTGREKALV